MSTFDERVAAAVRLFWRTRARQQKSQGAKTGKVDAGSRGAVTGGAHMDGFLDLICGLCVEAGIGRDMISCENETTLPVFFRPTKEWDFLVVVDGRLLASVEFKSQVGPSFGNNYNNRTEEALGNATDLWTAYRDGAFKTSPRPWLGYVMLLEESPGSTAPVKVKEPHFPVFEEFKSASYARRYELLCQKLVRERLYDAACLLLSDRNGGVKGQYREPSFDLSFRNFAASLQSHVGAYAKMRGRPRG